MGNNKDLSLEKLIQEAELYDNPVTEKQKDILRAAEKLFSEQGYSDTPTAEIAKQAKVTEKTLFKHFPTKASLLKRVMFPILLKLVIPTQIKYLKNLFQSAELNPEELFRKVMRDRLALANQHKDRLKFIIIELLKNDDLRSQVGNIWREQLWTTANQIIEKMQEEGILRRDIKVSTLTRTMMSMIMSYIFVRQVINPQGPWNDDEEIEQILSILMDGIRAR